MIYLKEIKGHYFLEMFEFMLKAPFIVPFVSNVDPLARQANFRLEFDSRGTMTPFNTYSNISN